MKKIAAKFPGKRVLIVDDNEINQEMIGDLFQLMEFFVDVADNGLKAIEMIKQKHYDLVLMDVQMPQMDGLEATQALRRQVAGGDKLIIVALTANVLEGDRERCLQAGMNDYLSKPVDIVKLEELLVKYFCKVS